MADERSPSLLQRWTRVRSATPRSQEPADMGTAFGMECSLEPGWRSEESMQSNQASEPGWLDRWRQTRARS